ncbi:MAG TPA: NmrA family NAD(P)-binding protein [Haliscomenobacter sp.]|uniref:NmrA family NAD(P)-binding protein n=1 Tax=Haliscomenobacter sp. TaxID=2717303 RepID=UPI002BD6F1A6|nr:NmrA family NAD(P)-binding protein [Haliscomenobacter sp.]HOY16125.1 NmrA family NAD(P)-binding protein [Haliscomenobacter sp.]
MAKVLITGATENVGTAVIDALSKLQHNLDLYAGVRAINEDKNKFANYTIQFSKFDFTDFTSYQPALAGCDILFLLRPPQISEVEKYFKPIVDTCKAEGVKHIVFLSVQGVENSKIIPHHKIEQLLVESKIAYTFLRPAYFMQNFTTTLRHDLIQHQQIYLPASRAKFTLIDVRDIGKVAAKILINISAHINQSYDLTSKESLTFSEMAETLSRNLGIDIQFKSPNLIHFFLTKRKEKMPVMLILVMIMLHYFPRFQQEPATTDWVEKITGRAPTSFEQFIHDHRTLLKA